MPLKEQTSARAKLLKLDVDEVLDVITETMLGIEFDKVYTKSRKIKYFVNRDEVSGFKISLEGKNKKDLFVSITKTLRI